MGQLPPCLIVAICCQQGGLWFFLYISAFLQPLEVKMMLFHCREVLHWEMLPLAGAAVLIFLWEYTIPRILYTLGSSAQAALPSWLVFLQLFPFCPYLWIS